MPNLAKSARDSLRALFRIVDHDNPASRAPPAPAFRKDAGRREMHALHSVSAARHRFEKFRNQVSGVGAAVSMVSSIGIFVSRQYVEWVSPATSSVRLTKAIGGEWPRAGKLAGMTTSLHSNISPQGYSIGTTARSGTRRAGRYEKNWRAAGHPSGLSGLRRAGVAREVLVSARSWRPASH